MFMLFTLPFFPFFLALILDEVSALVIDSGSWSTRAGYAGEDSPKLVFSTYYGYKEEEVTEEIPKELSNDEEKKSSEKQDSSNNTPELDHDGDTKMENGDDNVEAAATPAVAQKAGLDTANDTRAKSSNVKTAKVTKKRYYIGDNSLHLPRDGTEIKNPMSKDGIVEDWDAMEELWNYIFDKQLMVETTEHPLLLTEQTWNTTANRQKAMELAFEKHNFPAFYMIKSPVASLFAAGKGSGLVVDIGHNVTSVTPIVDGLPLYKSSRRSRFAGVYLSNQVRNLVEKTQGITLNPRYTIAKKYVVPIGAAARFDSRKLDISITESYHTLQQNRIIDEFKEMLVQVSDTPFTKEMGDTAVRRPFEFPDGSSREYGAERFEVAEALFNPKKYALPDQPTEDEPAIVYEPKIIQEGVASEAAAAANSTKDGGAPEPIPSYMYADTRPIPAFSNTLGLSQLIVDSINACDVDIRANLANNIVITGGSSQVQGLTDRINSDLSLAMAGVKIRLYAPGNYVERNYSSWVGASIISSLGTFHQLWISKKEYDEVGPAKLLERRFR
jgi:actin-related protein